MLFHIACGAKIQAVNAKSRIVNGYPQSMSVDEITELSPCLKPAGGNR